MIHKYSITELVSQIKSLLESEYSDLLVEGEITNLSRSSAGHWYFSLSDNNSMISCALFKMDAMKNPVLRTLKDGDKVILSGPLSVYNKRGTFQIIGKRIHKSGAGDLKLKFEQLKEKLTKEGLFDLRHKKKMPKELGRIAVITARDSAALQDFLEVMKRRSKKFDVLVIPSLVQGEKAATEIIKALNKAEQMEEVKTIVLTRGGGSLEDLWSFNDEKLVRKIFESQKFIINAVGHQTDFTLADYASDLRLETPTAAAEVLSQEQMNLDQKIDNLGRRLKAEFMETCHHFLARLEAVKPVGQLNLLRHRFEAGVHRFQQVSFAKRMPQLSGFYNLEMDLDRLQKNLLKASIQNIDKKISRLESLMPVLSAYNPKNILKKGYALVYDKETLVGSVAKFEKARGDLKLVFYDGEKTIPRTNR